MPVDRDEVHDALSCLSDNVRLAQSPLAECFPEIRDAGALDDRANRLRGLLLEAIEVLRPPRRLAFGSLESRHYDVLSLRYIEGMTAARVGRELSLGRRQVHRDLLEAEEKLSAVLDARLRAAEETAGNGALAPRSDAMSAHRELVHLSEPLASAVQLVAPLAKRLGIELRTTEVAEATALLDLAALRQILVQNLSAVVQSALPGIAEVSLQEESGTATFSIVFSTTVENVGSSILANARSVAASYGIPCRLQQLGDRRFRLLLPLAGHRPTFVLVVEDNPAAVHLYRRYLSTEAWRVHGLSDPRDAVEFAASARPDVILLDIMLPSLDGWSVLSELTEHAETHEIPVIICSVVYDPQLGTMLGARAYLRKPISQEALLAALRQVLAPS